MTRTTLSELDLTSLDRVTGGAGPAHSVDVGPIFYDTVKAAVEGFFRGGPDGAIFDGAVAHFEAMFKAGYEDEQAAGHPGDTYTPATMNEDGSITQPPFTDNSGNSDAGVHSADDGGAHAMDNSGDVGNNDSGSHDSGGSNDASSHDSGGVSDSGSHDTGGNSDGGGDHGPGGNDASGPGFDGGGGGGFGGGEV
jgi:hypothetical protein